MPNDGAHRLNEPRNLHSYIDGLRDNGDRPALLALRKSGSERWSYAELATTVVKLACGLVEAAGVKLGDPVALFADDGPNWIIACLAIVRAGAVAVPVDTQLSDRQLVHVLKDSGARTIVTNGAQAKRLNQLNLRGVSNFILLDRAAGEPLSWRNLLREEPKCLPAVAPDSPAVLFYTSGTTGLPKGVPLTHANVAFQLDAIRASGVVTERDRVLLPLPFHHAYPLVIGILTPLTLGLPLILPKALTGPQLIRAIKEAQASVIIGVPRLYGALYAGIEARLKSRGKLAAHAFALALDLSVRLCERHGFSVGKQLLAPLHKVIGPSLRMLACGGAALDPDLARKLEGLGWGVAVGYGLTETAPLLTLRAPGSGSPDSVGRPIEGISLRIGYAAHVSTYTGAGAKVPDDCREGEVQVRGANVFHGYHNRPDLTQRSFTSDGWFRTGDLGCFDPQGHLHVLGRISTLIVTEGGVNVQPEEIESAYAEQEFIKEIGVLQNQGQLVGVVVPDLEALHRKGETDLPWAIREAIASRSRAIPTYQRLTRFVVTHDPLPRTRLGKIQRQILAEHYDDLRNRSRRSASGLKAPVELSRQDHELLKHEAARKAWQWLQHRYPQVDLTLDTSPLLDLGVDSMEWLNLTVELDEHVGVELNEHAINRIDTVRDLLAEIVKGVHLDNAHGPLSLAQPDNVLSESQQHWIEPLNPWQRALAKAAFGLVSAGMHGAFRLRTDGLENLRNQDQYVFTPNHTSYVDPFALGAALRYERLRKTYWAAWPKATLNSRFSRGFSRLAHVVPVEAGSVVSSLAFGAEMLRRGYNLVWFPEGHRSRTGELLPFRKGIGMLLEAFPGVLVVPVIIDGALEAFPPGKMLPRLRRITVIFGSPIDPRELGTEGTGVDGAERIASALHDRVDALRRAVGH